jgi:glutathione S-transferase
MSNRLVIGNKRYSSWSLRGWLLVRLAGLEVTEEIIPLAAGTTAAIQSTTPAGLVPYLEHDGARIWESLAIAEYCAEHAPALWPAGRIARAHARSIAAEMHAGFRALRQAMPMNLGRNRPGAAPSAETLADIARIETIWADAREKFGGTGPYLYGAALTAADAMFAPVAARFLSYQPAVSAPSRSYCDALRAHPLIEAWYRDAVAEPAEWLLDKYENWD